MQIAAERGGAPGEAGVEIADVWGEVYASAIKGHGAVLDGAQPTFEIEDEDSSGAFEERFVRPDDGLLMVEPCGDMLFIKGGKGSWDSGRVRELAVNRIRQPFHLSRYTEMFGVERHQKLANELETDKEYLGVEFYKVVEDTLREDFGLFFKFIVFEPQSESEPLLVAPHPLFKDSAAASDDGFKPFYLLLTNVGKPEAHYEVLHVQGDGTELTEFMVVVDLQLSATLVVKAYKQPILDNGNCASTSVATLLNKALVPFPPVDAVRALRETRCVLYKRSQDFTREPDEGQGDPIGPPVGETGGGTGAQHHVKPIGPPPVV
jgi:hypothetical protein